MSQENIPIQTITATAISEMVRSGQYTAEDFAKRFIELVQKVDDQVHAFVYLDEKAVIQQARILDEGRAQGGELGSLAGVPIALKDAVDTFDMPSEFGSASLAGRQPRWDAKIAKLLRAQGAVIFGKTALPAFCLGTPAKTRNPHNLEHTPGGSSSGSAAAVAAGMVPVAIGTQTVGSVIRPASYCGIIGFKPTRGLISRDGLQPLCETIDQVGVFGRTIADVALVAQTLIAADENDPTTKGVLPRNLVNVALSEPPFKPKFVFVKTPFWNKMDAEARDAFEALIEAMGAETPVVELPTVANQAIDNLITVVESEFATAMSDHMKHTGEKVDSRTKDVVARGREIKAVDYLKAKRAIEPIAAGFDEFFDRFDAIITPSTLGAAPKGLDNTGDPIMNALWSYTGMPAISLPLLKSESGMPIGVQLIGQRHDDARLLRTSNWLLNNFDSITGA
jgi:Asp-tRNA(Asn)/Glu-tRNA(Gln) amidotransferase A subunit family amidase